MDYRITDWLPDSFYRSPQWRMLRAAYRRSAAGPPDPRIDDEWVEIALKLSVPLDALTGVVSPDVLTAFELWLSDQSPRWLLEGHLLTSQPFDEIAVACGLEEPVVRAYHELFFHVRPWLHAHDWVMTMAVRSTPANEFVGPQPAGVWKYAAYTGGPRVLEAVVAVTLNRPLPPWLRSGFVEDPHWEEAHFRLKAKLAIAIMTAKSDHQIGSLVDLYDQLRGLEAKVGRTIRDDPLLPVMGTILSALERSRNLFPNAHAAKTCAKRASCPESIIVQPNQGGTREE